MTSIKQPGACNSAIYANAIFPVGRPVVVCIPQPGNLAAKPAVSLRYYRSATATPSQDGSDDCRRTLQPLQASGGFFDRGRGTRPVDLNFWRALRAWSAVSSLLKYPQKSLSRLRVGFRFSPGFAALHEQQPKRRSEEWRTQIKGISNP
jgi:hypothetical protein